MRNILIQIMFMLLMCSICAQAGDVTWSGSGNWSNPANWSTGKIPTTTDDVIFDATSVSGCTIDVDTDISSLIADAAYTGTINATDSVISINNGGLNIKYIAFDGGNSTVKFTGSSEQVFNFATHQALYNLENANTGSRLLFERWGTLHLNAFTAYAGTETAFPSANRSTYFEDFIVLGTAANPAKITTTDAGSRARFMIYSLAKAEYTSFMDIGCAKLSIDATKGGIDLGNNENILFGAVRRWTGAGADNKWSTAANWSSAPTANETVIFDMNGLKDCVIDSDVEVGALVITQDYTGTISGGNSTITISDGQLSLNATSFVAQNSALKFTGSNNQYFRFPDNTLVNDIENAKSGGSLLFEVRANITLNKLTLNAGTETALPEYNKKFFLNHFIAAGTPEMPATLHTRTPGRGVRFRLRDSQVVSNTSFQDINAVQEPIIATDGCVDLGGNLNFVFALPNTAPTVDAGEDFTAELSLGADMMPIIVDDGQPGPLAITWTLVAGEEKHVTIDDATLANPYVTFAKAGTYVFNVVVNDGEFEDSDEVVVAVIKDVNSGSDGTITDKAKPLVQPRTPVAKSEIEELRPLISANVYDASSGVDAETIVVKLDKKVIAAVVVDGYISFTPTDDLKGGKHKVEVSVTDFAGNTRKKKWDFKIKKEKKPSKHKEHKISDLRLLREISCFEFFSSPAVNGVVVEIRAKGWGKSKAKRLRLPLNQ